MSKQSLLVLFLLGFVELKRVTLTEYCFVRQANTPCMGCQRSLRCGNTEDGFEHLSEKERAHILHRHNQLRNEVAGGHHETKYYLRPAKDMQVLNWDKEVEFFAACYIKHCAFHHDRIRVTLDGNYLGQSLFLASVSDKITDRIKLLSQAFDSWANEMNYLTNINVLHVYKSYARILAEGPTAHLMQIIWGDSKLLGCAIMHYNRDGKFNYLVICNYSPKGNIPDNALYNPGYPECARDVRNTNYTNLCGNTRTFEDDKYVYPVELNAANGGFGIRGLAFAFLSRSILHLIAL